MKSCKGNLSAVFIEPIQGEGGYVIPPKEFVKGVSKLCREHNALLVADEIQAGCFRTGKFLAIDNFGVKPDTVCLGKAIAGGLPVGATVFQGKNSKWPAGAHANTFGGNLATCAAGVAVLDFLKKKRLGAKAAKTGKAILKRVKEIEENSRLIGDVRGKGLMIGVELVKNKKTKAHAITERRAFVCKAYQEGLLLLPCGTSSVRIAPPLTISLEDALKGMDIFESSLKKIEGK
jgi:4-aminobutyrate aminotransferase